MQRQNHNGIVGTVILHNVDFKLLDKQRLLLARLTCNDSFREQLSKQELDAVDGIQNMLDYWSDNNQDVLK